MEADELPEGVHSYKSFQQCPTEIRRYYAQRYNLFSQYDAGIWLTDDMWFSVTPEDIAWQISNDIWDHAPETTTTIVDAFSGVGGNTIAFALTGWENIIPIELDETVMKCAVHNTSVYEVSNHSTNIWWLQGDVFDWLKKASNNKSIQDSHVVFASPPWGGQGYRADDVFDLEMMTPYSLKTLVEAISAAVENFVLYLPRSSDLNQLAKYVPRDKKIKIRHYCLGGSSKAICAFFGNFNFVDSDDIESGADQET